MNKNEQVVIQIIGKCGELITTFAKAKVEGWYRGTNETVQDRFLRELKGLEETIATFRKLEMSERQKVIEE